ncbi:hypothetical protein AB0K18_10145 [Nonomuraea sp. NPDC049421]|uniref:hypothetical protein n=1 Tax=Nonomuraea sp. NPDC049421 TaxID=3155275 RepID=UPI00341BD988
MRRGGQKALNEALALVHERQPGVEVTTLLEEGTPATVLREQAKAAVTPTPRTGRSVRRWSRSCRGRSPGGTQASP